MNLNKIISKVAPIKIIGKTDLEINNVTLDSNTVSKGDLFICISGKVYDGHDYVSVAQNYGAIAIVTEREMDTSLTQIIVKDSRLAMSRIASAFYGNAHKKLKVIGVVGTNGKTTTTHLIKQILDNANIKSGVIGTLGTFYGDKVIEPTLTTPDPLGLHKIFAKMCEDGVKVAIMEVSAHAIYYNKIDGINFDIVVFTNFSRDHLDFFKDIEEYKNVKKKFFIESKYNYAVINTDDEVGRELAKQLDKCITYGISNPADVFVMDVKRHVFGSRFILNLFDSIHDVKLKLMGDFNISNALASAVSVSLLGVKTDVIASALNCLHYVSGRLECVFDGEYKIYVDYAHTPDGLQKSISTLKQVCKGRLITIFGCGGNRDVGKREQMGRISGKSSDFTIITSDNPRYEEQMDIICQIEKGVLKESKGYIDIQNRKEAIEYAINMAKAEDIILIAGKGSEQYQEILGIKHPYNDKDTVREIIRGLQ